MMNAEVKAQIGRMISEAQRWENSDIRTELFDRYMGEPYGDEQKNRSAFVSTDVSDAVEAILPDLMDLFMSSEDIAEFAPVGPEDEEAAKQETAVVSHVFWQKNPGFETLYCWIKEGLVQQISYLKRGWDERERVEIEEYEGLTGDELLTIIGGKEDYEVLSKEITDEGFNVKIRCVKREKRYVIECIPQEEFFVSPRWGKVTLEGVPCCGHRAKKEAGWLREMGFGERSIEEATQGTDDTGQTEARFNTKDNSEDDADQGDDATRMVEVFEAYVRADWNNDGRAELLKVWATGDGSKILQWKDGSDAIEEVSSVPFSAFTPYIVPHRHVGRSVAELVDDLARVKTVLIRQTLDNIYLTNYARPMFDENAAGSMTFEDLLNPAPGAPVRTGGAEIFWQTPQPVIGATLPLLEVMDNLKENRVGATRYNQGLDAESLNKTARGIQMIMNASQKKTLLIARVIAETGLRDLFMGIHRDLRAGPIKELAMKLRGKWVSVNPRVWKDRTDMVVNIGMGSGDRDNVRQGLMLMGQLQRELMASGSRMVDEPRIYETANRMMGTFGFKTVEPFLNDPKTLPPPPPPQPDPQLELAKEQMAIMRLEAEGRVSNQKMQIELQHQREMQSLGLKSQAEDRQMAKTASDIMTDAERLDLDRVKAQNEDDFKRDQLEAQEQAKSAPAASYEE